MTAPGADELHVWTVALRGPPRFGDIFSSAERSRADRFVRDEDRDAFLHARGALRVVLGRYLGVAPGAVAFAAGQWGKPELAEPLAARGVTFNVSHAGAVALIAVGRDRPVGIDVERVRAMPEALAIAARVLGARSAEALERLDPSRRDLAFLGLWTAHEACIKALGLALAVAEPAVRIGWREAGPVCEWADPRVAPNGLAIAPVATVPDYVATLAWVRRADANAKPDDVRIARFDFAGPAATF